MEHWPKAGAFATVLSGAALVMASACAHRSPAGSKQVEPPTLSIADFQALSHGVASKLAECPLLAGTHEPLPVHFRRIRSRGDDRVDTLSLTERVRAAVQGTGKIKFVNAPGRGSVEEEYRYKQGASAPGQADYVMDGELTISSLDSPEGKKSVYRLETQVTQARTSQVMCSVMEEERK